MSYMVQIFSFYNPEVENNTGKHKRELALSTSALSFRLLVTYHDIFLVKIPGCGKGGF